MYYIDSFDSLVYALELSREPLEPHRRVALNRIL